MFQDLKGRERCKGLYLYSLCTAWGNDSNCARVGIACYKLVNVQ